MAPKTIRPSSKVAGELTTSNILTPPVPPSPAAETPPAGQIALHNTRYANSLDFTPQSHRSSLMNDNVISISQPPVTLFQGQSTQNPHVQAHLNSGIATDGRGLEDVPNPLLVHPGVDQEAHLRRQHEIHMLDMQEERDYQNHQRTIEIKAIEKADRAELETRLRIERIEDRHREQIENELNIQAKTNAKLKLAEAHVRLAKAQEEANYNKPHPPRSALPHNAAIAAAKPLHEPKKKGPLIKSTDATKFKHWVQLFNTYVFNLPVYLDSRTPPNDQDILSDNLRFNALLDCCSDVPLQSLAITASK